MTILLRVAQPANRTAEGKFKPGTSGNPSGKPRLAVEASKAWAEFLEELLPSGQSRRDALLERYWTIAFSGEDPATTRDAVNRILGKVPDRMVVDGPSYDVIHWAEIANSAAPALGADACTPEPGSIQGSDLRETLGEDEAGSA